MTGRKRGGARHKRWTIWLAALLWLPGFAQARDVVVHAGVLFDGVAATSKPRMSIVIHDDRIVSIEDGFVRRPGAQIIDLSKATVLPGLIDTHVHLSLNVYPGDAIRNLVTRDDFDDAIAATKYARDTLMAGFTAVRDVGANSAPAIFALKRAIASGTIEGPRIWAAGVALGPTGGHGDLSTGLREGLENIPGWKAPLIDSPDDARRAVRQLKRAGADLIKIMPSGGVMSVGDDPSEQLMTDDEIRATVETAKALHMRVAAHAHGAIAINHAVLAGVDSIEHGTFANDESYSLMKAHGTYLVPTLLVAAKVSAAARAHPGDMAPSVAEKALAVAPHGLANLQRAYAAGVKIAFGSDTFGYSAHGENAQEFALMVKAGMTPSDAILAATRNAADLLGASADVGTIQPGRFADLIAVTGDPLKDVTILEHVTFVMQGGVVKKEPALANAPKQ